MREKKIITTKRAPAAKGPYSQGTVAGNLLFVAGQGPVDPQTGNFLLGDIQSECKLTLQNVEAILRAAGSSLDKVLQCTVYLRDLNDFKAMNEIYSLFFPSRPPARTTIQAGDLVRGIKIEIDVIAFVSSPRVRGRRSGARTPRRR